MLQITAYERMRAPEAIATDPVYTVADLADGLLNPASVVYVRPVYFRNQSHRKNDCKPAQCAKFDLLDEDRAYNGEDYN